jgi:putative GTP pyrophosphokinase
MPAVASLPSKGEINRCGELLANLSRGGDLPGDPDEVDRAWQVVSDYRAAHGYPLGKVTMGLRSMVNTEGARVVVSQRLKRMPRLISKLARMEKSNLARLEDVGGCRAVLSTPDELQRVYRRLRKNWGSTIVRERDYIAAPKDIGYRALHVVVQRDERRIEVQLRTESQQRWANAIEVADSRLGLSLKDGAGPAEMVAFFTAAGEVQHLLDYGLPVSDEALSRLEATRDAVVAAGYYRR